MSRHQRNTPPVGLLVAMILVIITIIVVMIVSCPPHDNSKLNENDQSVPDTPLVEKKEIIEKKLEELDKEVGLKCLNFSDIKHEVIIQLEYIGAYIACIADKKSPEDCRESKDYYIKKTLSKFESDESKIEIIRTWKTPDKKISKSIKQYLEDLKNDKKDSNIIIEWIDIYFESDFIWDAVAERWEAKVKIVQLYSKEKYVLINDDMGAEANRELVYQDVTDKIATVYIEKTPCWDGPNEVKDACCLILFGDIKATSIERGVFNQRG